MHYLDPKHRTLGPPSGGDQAASPLGVHPGGYGPEHGTRGLAGSGGNDPRDTRPDHATRWIQTTRGILSYQDVAPFLAEQVALTYAAEQNNWHPLMDVWRQHFVQADTSA
ncbi:MAG: hypothetical protein SynsKO_37130 [Synoicihabitans sp.]